MLLLPPVPPDYRAPAGREFARVVPGGVTILPNGRFLTPPGERRYTGENLWRVLRRAGDGLLAGFCEEELTTWTSRGVVSRIPMKGLAPAGAFLPDGSLLASLGDTGAVAILDPVTFAMVAKIETGAESHIVDIAVSADGTIAYALDIANQKLVTIDLSGRKVASVVPAGRQPYALVMGGGSLYVANIGLFDYTLVPPGTGPNPRGLSRPPFAYPSPEAERGVTFEGRAITGLGSPLVPDGQSIWRYDLSSPSLPKVAAKAKAGLLIRAIAAGGETKAVGGSAPNAVLLAGTKLYVSNANNDTVQEFDTRSLKVLRTFRLSASEALAKLRGTIPSGMAHDAKRGRLYVCESGLNSVAVIDLKSGRTVGRIPSGWFPMSLTLSPDGRNLSVATQKGLGRGPRGALHPRPKDDERTGFPDMPGMIQNVAVPTDAELRRGNGVVLRNAGMVSSPTAPKTAPFPDIETVVFITKENHTFDGIFGGHPGARSEPEYAEFGRRGWIKEKGKDERIAMMPNHHRLAEQYAISDNFYMEPQASGDGHRWLVGVYPSLWTSRVFYAGWNFKASPTAKGRYVSFGSNGSQIPEDYLENGSLWEHLERGGVTFRNYGEGFEFPGVGEGPPATRSGASEVVNFPMPKALFDNTCFAFPIYNTNIPDIARVDWFKEDLQAYRKSHGGKIPRFINIALCNDHGAAPRPAEGYPYVASYMADNDLALGRTVDYLSHLPEWKKMAIFVTQDDSGADDDSVDRHRSFVLAISPFAKRGYVGHDHTSIMSIIRSVYGIFGLGPNNLFDATATPLNDLFTAQRDETPYNHVPVDPRVFRPEATFDPSDPQFKRRRATASAKMDDPAFFEWLRRRG